MPSYFRGLGFENSVARMESETLLGQSELSSEGSGLGTMEL